MIKRLSILAILIGIHLLVSYYLDSVENYKYTMASAIIVICYMLYFIQKLGEEPHKPRYKSLFMDCPFCKRNIHLPHAPVVPKGVVEFKCNNEDCGTKFSIEFTNENYERCIS